MEISFVAPQTEESTTAGFVPLKDRAETKAKNQAAEKGDTSRRALYERVYRGPMPEHKAAEAIATEVNES